MSFYNKFSMRKIITVALLIIPIIPIIWFFLYVSHLMPLSFDSKSFAIMGGLSVLTVLFYMQHIIRNKHFSTNTKVFLLIGLLMFSNPTQIYYWFKYRENLLQ